MKRFILFALASSFSVFAFLPTLCAQDSDATFPNYVVIGAFEHEKNAINFTDEAKHNKYPARFEMNPNRNLYYVYVMTTDDRELARAEALRLRGETKYFDAWVYSGAFGILDVSALSRNVGQDDINPVTGQRLENVSTGEQPRSPILGKVVADATSGQRQPVQNRLVKNESGQPLDQLTTSEDESDQERISNPKQGTSTRRQPSQENPGDATSDESIAQRSDGVKASTKKQQQGSTVTPNPSSTESTDARQRQAVATKDPNGMTTAKPATGTSAQQNQNRSSTNTNGEQNEQLMNQTGPQQSVTNGTKTTVTSSAGMQTNGSRKEQVPVGEPDAVTNLNEPGSADEVNIPAPVRQSTEPLSSEEVVGKDFYFHLFRADNQKTVPGEVDAIDFEKSRKMGTYPANEGVKVTMAGGKMKHISFVCQVFGYRKQQQEFDPENPSEQIYLDNAGNVVVPFELVRLQKGDIAIMYNVFFFKDAAVMRPESRYEVNNLLDLLVENPSYKIIIHGHTNGNASGKIIRMDKPGNFYSLSGTKQGFGSAKQLSEERAIVIREFLISSGISADRMQVRAWAGKKPIHDKHSVRAQENVRVEIEILSQ